MLPPPAEPARAGRWIFLFALSLFVLTASGRIVAGDGVVLLETTEALVEHGSLRIDRDLSMFGEKPGESPFNSGLSIIAAPFYALGKAVAAVFPEPSRWPIIMLFCSLANALFCALIAFVFFRFGFALTGRLRPSVINALLLILCTPLWSASKPFWREPLSALGLVTTVYLLFLATRRRHLAGLFFAGLAADVAPWAREEYWTLIPFFAAYVFVSSRRARPGRARDAAVELAVFLLAPLGGLAISAVFSELQYGRAFGGGFSGHNLAAAPLAVGFYGLLFSPMVGLFVFAPLVAFGLFGFARLAPRDKPLTFLLLAILAFMTVLYAKYHIWAGGQPLGPRYLMPLVPLLMLSLAFLLEWGAVSAWLTAGLVMTAVYGFGAQILSVAGDFQRVATQEMHFVGGDRELLTPFLMLHSPFPGLWEQLRSGALDIIWLRLAANGLPLLFAAIPLVCLALLGLSARRLLRLAAAPAEQRIAWRTLPPPARRAIAGLAALSLLLLAAILGGRLHTPRGLTFHLLADAGGGPALIRAAPTALPQADEFANPCAGPDAGAKTAVWQGVLRIPSYYFANQLYFLTNGVTRATIGDKLTFDTSSVESGRLFVMQRQVDLTRGYYPVRIAFACPLGDPRFEARWSIRDYAFRDLIRRDYWFPAMPSALARLLIDYEAHLVILLAVVVFLALGQTFAAVGAAAEPPAPRQM
jgi:hypothetical protein